MPSRKTFAPGALPAHDMLWWCCFPQCEVGGIIFFFLAFQFTGIFQQLLYFSSTELTVIVVSSIFFYIEVHRSVFLVGITVGNQFFNHFNLLYDMSCSSRFYGWWNTVELQHSPMEEVGVFLYQLHGF